MRRSGFGVRDSWGCVYQVTETVTKAITLMLAMTATVAGAQTTVQPGDAGECAQAVRAHVKPFITR